MTFDVTLMLTQIMKFGFDIGLKLEMFINSKSYMDEIVFAKCYANDKKIMNVDKIWKKMHFSQIIIYQYINM